MKKYFILLLALALGPIVIAQDMDLLTADVSSVSGASPVTVERVMVYPQPAYEFLHVELRTDKAATIRLRVEDPTGTERYEFFRLARIDGDFTCRMDIRGLEKGVYRLFVEDAEGNELERREIEKR